jgi:hypothetical protein
MGQQRIFPTDEGNSVTEPLNYPGYTEPEIKCHGQKQEISQELSNQVKAMFENQNYAAIPAAIDNICVNHSPAGKDQSQGHDR